MRDREILDCIHALVAAERRLRDRHESGRTGEAVDLDRLAEIGENLAQMWDLLRRRRALRAAGVDPDTVDLRPAGRAELSMP